MLFGISQLLASSSNKALRFKPRVINTANNVTELYNLVHRRGHEAKVHEAENNIVRPKTKTGPTTARPRTRTRAYNLASRH